MSIFKRKIYRLFSNKWALIKNLLILIVILELLGIAALYIGDQYYLKPIVNEKSKIYADLDQKYTTLSNSLEAKKLIASKYIYEQKQQNAYVKLTRLWEILVDINKRLNEFKGSIKITQYKINLASFDIRGVVRLPRILYMEGGLIDTLSSLDFVKTLEVKKLRKDNGGYEFYIKGFLNFNDDNLNE